jgi:hypothetical protein
MILCEKIKRDSYRLYLFYGQCRLAHYPLALSVAENVSANLLRIL